MASSTTSITSSPDPSVCGEDVVFTATVSPVPPETATPTGTVTFIVSDDGPSIVVPLDGAGQAQATFSGLGVGVHQAVAVYSGDGTFDPSSSPLDNHTVNLADTMTTVTSDPAPSVCGEPVELCASVVIESPGSGIPTGTVTFTGPGGLNETATLDAVGQACITTTVLETGIVTATYNGDDCAASSTGSLAVTVDPAPTTTVVTADPDPSVCGEFVEVCAVVTIDPPGAGTPTGTVTFTGPGGLNQTVTLDATGQACLTNNLLATGTITATYNGDTCAASSTGTVGITVNPADTSTAVSVDPNPSVCGELVEVCAVVTAIAPSVATPTGTVTFTGPGGFEQTVTLGGGQACLTTTALESGTLTATYNGSSCFNGSAGTTTVTVDAADTTTVVTATPDPSVCGQLVEVCAVVTRSLRAPGHPPGRSPSPDPAGSNRPSALGGGQACLTTTALATGTVTAVYNGDACFNTSTDTVAVTVNPAATTTVVTADPDPSVCGQSVEVCATVTTNPPGSGTPTGTVTFTGPADSTRPSPWTPRVRHASRPPRWRRARLSRRTTATPVTRDPRAPSPSPSTPPTPARRSASTRTRRSAASPSRSARPSPPTHPAPAHPPERSPSPDPADSTRPSHWTVRGRRASRPPSWRRAPSPPPTTATAPASPARWAARP